MVRDIKSNLFLDGIDTEHAHSVKQQEVGGHDGSDPSDNPQNTKALSSKEVGSSSIDETIVSMFTVGVDDASWLSKKTNGNTSPDSTSKVNRNGIYVNREAKMRGRCWKESSIEISNLHIPTASSILSLTRRLLKKM